MRARLRFIDDQARPKIQHSRLAWARARWTPEISPASRRAGLDGTLTRPHNSDTVHPASFPRSPDNMCIQNCKSPHRGTQAVDPYCSTRNSVEAPTPWFLLVSQRWEILVPLRCLGLDRGILVCCVLAKEGWLNHRRSRPHHESLGLPPAGRLTACQAPRSLPSLSIGRL